jgi:hypothetical protein
MEWYHISFELRLLTAQLFIPRKICHWTWNSRGLLTERGLAGAEGKALYLPQFAHGLLLRSRRQFALAMPRPSHVYIYTWTRTCTHGFNMAVRRGQSYVRNYRSTTVKIFRQFLWFFGEKIFVFEKSTSLGFFLPSHYFWMQVISQSLLLAFRIAHNFTGPSISVVPMSVLHEPPCTKHKHTQSKFWRLKQ